MRGLGAALVAVGAWVVLAPRALGGDLTYVVASGSSMEPRIREGDLVVVRRAGTYEVGDVAAYRSADLRATVLHRIVDVDGGRFAFRGDANDWLDPEQPGAEDVLGALWLRVPKVGLVIHHLRSPAALAAGAVMIAVPTLARRWARRRAGRSGPSRWRPRLAVAGVLTTTVAGAGVAVVALALPADGSTPPPIAYRQDVTIGYAAPAPLRLFDGTTVRTGQPVFVQLTDAVTLHATIAFASDAPHEVAGHAQLAVRMSDDTGWERTVLTSPRVALGDGDGDGDGATTLRAELPVAELLGLIDRLETTTGHQRDSYALAVETTVDTDGTVAGRPVDTSFAPVLELRIDRAELRLATPPDAGTAADPDGMTFSQPGSLPGAPSDPAELTLLGNQVPARAAGSLGAGVGAAGLGGLGWLGARRHAGATPAKLLARARRRSAQLIVEIARFPVGRHTAVVDIVDLDALAAVAVQRGQPILEHADGPTCTWWVVDGETTYRCAPARLR